MIQYFDKADRILAKCKSRYLRNPKKAAIKFIWWNLCYLFSLHNNKSSFRDDKQHIAITFAGGIGDYLFAAKYVEALNAYLSNNSVIDILCEEHSIATIKAIFYGKKYINEILSQKTKNRYDLHIRLIRFPEILSYQKKRLDSKTIEYIRKLENFYSKNHLMIRNDYIGWRWSLHKGRVRENQADIDNILNMAQVDFAVNLPDGEKDILNKFGLEKEKYITLQTGAGKHFQHIANEVRQWPTEYYNELAEALKKKHPQYKIIQLGEECQNACQCVDEDLRGKTSINELFVLLKYAKLHISQEGGMPIIRHFVKGGKSVVLFGPTDEKFFGFAENINLSARPCVGCCEWLTNDWMCHCLKTGGVAECMKKLTPQIVEEIIL